MTWGWCQKQKGKANSYEVVNWAARSDPSDFFFPVSNQIGTRSLTCSSSPVLVYFAALQNNEQVRWRNPCYKRQTSMLTACQLLRAANNRSNWCRNFHSQNCWTWKIFLRCIATSLSYSQTLPRKDELLPLWETWNLCHSRTSTCHCLAVLRPQRYQGFLFPFQPSKCTHSLLFSRSYRR